jgi:hypothetical protein
MTRLGGGDLISPLFSTFFFFFFHHQQQLTMVAVPHIACTAVDVGEAQVRFWYISLVVASAHSHSTDCTGRAQTPSRRLRFHDGAP